MKQKYLRLFLLMSIVYTNAFAQPVITNQKTIGGIHTDNLMSTSLTKDGGLIVGGYSDSPISGEKTEKSRHSFLIYEITIMRSRTRLSIFKQISII